MKKSAIYHAAMLSVMNDEKLTASDKLEIIAVLLEKKSTAEWCEKQEVEKQEDNF